MSNQHENYSMSSSLDGTSFKGIAPPSAPQWGVDCNKSRIPWTKLRAAYSFSRFSYTERQYIYAKITLKCSTEPFRLLLVATAKLDDQIKKLSRLYDQLYLHAVCTSSILNPVTRGDLEQFRYW